MRLNELKQRVYQYWERRCWYNQCAIEPENFKPEIGQYGDLRRKSTWEKALARFRALNIADACLDSYELILRDFNYKPDDWDYEYRYKIR